MSHHNQKKLSDKLRELFKITGERRGVEGVFTFDDTYSSVVFESSIFTFGDTDMQKLFEAKEYAKAKGFFMTPRMERESGARHHVTFYF